MSIPGYPFQHTPVEWAVRRLRNNRYGGPSGIRSDYLKGGIEKARKAEAVDVEAAEEAVEATGGPGEEGTEA